MAKKDREFVAAQPSDDVALANAADEQARSLHERFIAGLMAKAVVDDLQPIDVDEQQRGLLVVTDDAVDQPLQSAHETATIRQADEAVLVSEHVELLDAFLQLRDLAAQSDNLANHFLDVDDVGHLIRHCPRAPVALVCAARHSAIPKP